MKPVLEGLRALGPARLAALGAVGLSMLVMLGLLALHGGAPAQQSLLYGDLDLREAAQMVEALDHAHIAHQESSSGDRILVASAEVARARLILAKDGLPSGGSVGYEIFDRSEEMTASQFQQDINETRALEGELARSVRMLQGVRNARIHLVLPKRQPFSREVQAASASVVLTMAGAAHLDPQGVQAILNLVAAAVPGLKSSGIAIIDSRGNLLARAGQPAGENAVAQTGEEIRRTTEVRLSRAVEEILEQSLGAGHVRAEAAVELNFDRVDETTESYDPNQQVVRSTQTSTDKSNSTEADKAVSVQNNLPNADAGQVQSGSQQQKQEETTNYELGKTVRTSVHSQPQIAHISLAVIVDTIMQIGRNGEPTWKERNLDDIARIKRLAESAIGYNEKRGDKVEVVAMRFATPDEGPTLSQANLLGLNLDKSDLLGLGQSAILSIVVLLALLFVVKPMVMRLATIMPQHMIEVNNAALASPDDGSVLTSTQPNSGRSVISGPAMLTDESMVSVSKVEGQLKASSLRKLSEMVEKHPEESLSIMRSWLSQEPV